VGKIQQKSRTKAVFAKISRNDLQFYVKQGILKIGNFIHRQKKKQKKHGYRGKGEGINEKETDFCGKDAAGESTVSADGEKTNEMEHFVLSRIVAAGASNC